MATSVGVREGEAATMDTWTEHERRSQLVRAGSVHSTITTSIKGRVEYEQTGLVSFHFAYHRVCVSSPFSFLGVRIMRLGRSSPRRPAESLRIILGVRLTFASSAGSEGILASSR